MPCCRAAALTRTCIANSNPTRLRVGVSCHHHPFLLIASLLPLCTILHSLQNTLTSSPHPGLQAPSSLEITDPTSQRGKLKSPGTELLILKWPMGSAPAGWLLIPRPHPHLPSGPSPCGPWALGHLAGASRPQDHGRDRVISLPSSSAALRTAGACSQLEATGGKTTTTVGHVLAPNLHSPTAAL